MLDKVSEKKKRSNPYCIEDVMAKHNISYDEAIKNVARLKESTTMNLSGFLKRYGEEEGKLRFDQFRERSSHTKEKFISKFGDKWEEEWNAYLKEKSCSLEKFIERYGEEDGKFRYEEYQKKKSFSNSLDGYVEKYGYEKGKEKYEKITKKRRAGSLGDFIERYGEDLGLEKYKNANSKKDSCSLKFYLDKYGEEGNAKYKHRRMLISPLFYAIKKEYGYEEAVRIYSQSEKSNFKEISQRYGEKIGKHKTNIKKIKKPGPVSKESCNFFKKLENLINRKLQYGSKSRELKLLNKETLRYFSYDCLDEYSKTIIEFHGVTWHPKEGNTSWTNPFGDDYDKIRKRDLEKQNLANLNGYNYVVVYSDDARLNNDMNDKIKYIVEVINANSQKNKKK